MWGTASWWDLFHEPGLLALNVLPILINPNSVIIVGNFLLFTVLIDLEATRQ